MATIGASTGLTGTLVSQGQNVAVLLDSRVLSGRSACRLKVRLVGEEPVTALGLQLDEDTALLVLRNRRPSAKVDAATSVLIERVDVLAGTLSLDKARTRLHALIGGDGVESLSGRGARHALLYILEARDPDLRRQRLNMLRAALGVMPPTEDKAR